MIRQPAPRPPTAQQVFERRCYYLGITDADEVARLWREKTAADAAAERAAADAKEVERKKRRKKGDEQP